MSIRVAQAVTPPWTWTASRKPAAFTAASASAERTPVLQCSTIGLSFGSCASARPERISSLGISYAPGMGTISYSFGSRTSMSSKSLPASIISLSSSTVIVEPAAASWASTDTTPQKLS